MGEQQQMPTSNPNPFADMRQQLQEQMQQSHHVGAVHLPQSWQQFGGPATLQPAQPTSPPMAPAMDLQQRAALEALASAFPRNGAQEMSPQPAAVSPFYHPTDFGPPLSSPDNVGRSSGERSSAPKRRRSSDPFSELNDVVHQQGAADKMPLLDLNNHVFGGDEDPFQWDKQQQQR
jgi:hypothetical protein